MERRPGYLLLEDGRRFDGYACGAPATALGEPTPRMPVS